MKRLSQNIISLLSADIARRIMGFISVVFLARALGAEGFGLVNLGFAVLAYGMVLSTAGFAAFGTKKIAQGESADIVGQIIGNRLATTMLVFVAIVLITLICVDDSVTCWLIILFSFTLIPQIFYIDWYFLGKERMGTVSIARIISSAIYLIIIIMFVQKSIDVMWVAIGTILGDSFAATWLFFSFRKLNPSVKLQFSPSLQFLKQSMPLAVGIILATLTINFPPLALGILCTKVEVGIYSAASKLVFFLLVGDRILSFLLLPASARKHTQSSEALAAMLQDALRWILLLCLPIAIGGTLLAEDIIALVFGAEYGSSAVVFSVFIWYFFLTILHTVYATGLIGIGKDKSYSKNMIITAIAYLVFVTLGSLWFGAIGAAFGVAIAEGSSVVMMRRSLTMTVPLQSPVAVGRILLSIFLMAVSVLLMRELNLWLTVLAGSMVYGLFIITLRAIKSYDVKSLLARF